MITGLFNSLAVSGSKLHTYIMSDLGVGLEVTLYFGVVSSTFDPTDTFLRYLCGALGIGSSFTLCAKQSQARAACGAGALVA